ncbi:MAG: hypothetical protein ACK419_06305, partial [Pyrinomonadaceae bacterium]
FLPNEHIESEKSVSQSTVGNLKKKISNPNTAISDKIAETIPLPENLSQESLRSWVLAHPATKAVVDFMNARIRNFGKVGSEEKR